MYFFVAVHCTLSGYYNFWTFNVIPTDLTKKKTGIGFYPLFFNPFLTNQYAGSDFPLCRQNTGLVVEGISGWNSSILVDGLGL